MKTNKRLIFEFKENLLKILPSVFEDAWWKYRDKPSIDYICEGGGHLPADDLFIKNTNFTMIVSFPNWEMGKENPIIEWKIYPPRIANSNISCRSILFEEVFEALTPEHKAALAFHIDLFAKD